MPKGSLHFYINLRDDEPLWFDAIFAGCTNIGIQSVPGFIGQVPSAGAHKNEWNGETPDVLGYFTNISRQQSATSARASAARGAAHAVGRRRAP